MGWRCIVRVTFFSSFFAPRVFLALLGFALGFMSFSLSDLVSYLVGVVCNLGAKLNPSSKDRHGTEKKGFLVASFQNRPIDPVPSC